MELQTTYKKVINEEKQGEELYFDSIPCIEDRNIMKSNGYRWNNSKKCWYKKLGNTNTTKIIKPKENEFGIKIGDIFKASWGYEQTNVNFFQVVALRGTKQVVVKEVVLHMTDEETISWCAANRRYTTKDPIILENSLFIDDNSKGQISTVKMSSYSHKPYIHVGRYHELASFYEDNDRCYESWGY